MVNDFTIILVGTRRGLYDSQGKWIKWLNKQEYNKHIIKGTKIIDRRFKND